MVWAATSMCYSQISTEYTFELVANNGVSLRSHTVFPDVVTLPYLFCVVEVASLKFQR